MLLGLSTLPQSNVVSAQEQDSTKIRQWVFLGLGGAESTSTGYIAGTIGYSFGHSLLHQVRGNFASEFTLGPVPDGIGSVSYAVGRGNLGRHHLAALFGGLGLASFYERSGIIEARSRVSVGLVLNAQAILFLERGIGFGIDFYANVNPRSSFRAMNVVLVIGGTQWPRKSR